MFDYLFKIDRLGISKTVHQSSVIGHFPDFIKTVIDVEVLLRVLLCQVIYNHNHMLAWPPILLRLATGTSLVCNATMMFPDPSSQCFCPCWTWNPLKFHCLCSFLCLHEFFLAQVSIVKGENHKERMLVPSIAIPIITPYSSFGPRVD